MKKRFGLYAIIWTILLVLFNIITFVPPQLEFQNKFSTSFWIGYVFITLMFFAQLICACVGLNVGSTKKLFYKVYMLVASYLGLAASFLIGGVCIFFNDITYWIGTILCAIVFAVTLIAVVVATIVFGAVAKTDKKNKAQTFFIKSMTTNASTLVAQAPSEEAKAICSKIYDAFRYSDPMNNEALGGIEEQITAKYALLAEAVSANDVHKASSLSNDLIALIGDRNSRCKLLK